MESLRGIEMCEWLCSWLEPAVLIQIVIAVGLGVYAWDTRKLRKSSQRQNEISQELNEAMQKPCLVPLVQKNESRVDATLWLNERILRGTSGNTGDVVFHNIGNGPAFNIRYGVQEQTGDGFLPYILPQEKEPATLPLNHLRSLLSNQDEEELSLLLSYESLSGRRHQSTLLIREGLDSMLVVTDCQFRSYPPQAAKPTVSERMR